MITQQCIKAKLAAFTLIELIGFLVLFIFIYLFGHLIHAKIGGILGWLIGGLAGIAAFLVVGATLVLLKNLAVGGIPHLPRCLEGTCRGSGMFIGSCGDYKWQKYGNTYNYVCKHGGHYNRHGGRFVIVNEDGTEEPYLIWRPFRGWLPDKK